MTDSSLSTKYLQDQGILNANENFETIYLNEDEIDVFMKRYINDNPDAEIETRYINPPVQPIELTQRIEVKWLRPPTPEIPPIIIKEVCERGKELPPLRIVEQRRTKCPEEASEPIVIRERPPVLAFCEPSPNIAYVQHVVKKEIKKEDQQQEESKEDVDHPIKIEHVRSESQLIDNNNNNNNNNISANQNEAHFSFEQEIEDYEEIEEDDGPKRASGSGSGNGDEVDEQQLKYYEEKLKQTLFEEYLLKLEREKLEKKLNRSGLLEERLRERSISRDRHSLLNLQNLSSLNYNNNNNNINTGPSSTINSQLNNQNLNDTSSYRSIPFAKVGADQKEYSRINDILRNPNSLTLKNKHDADNIARSLNDIAASEQNNNSYNSSRMQNRHSYVKTGTNYVPVGFLT
jgi:hypothetical protein